MQTTAKKIIIQTHVVLRWRKAAQIAPQHSQPAIQYTAKPNMTESQPAVVGAVENDAKSPAGKQVRVYRSADTAFPSVVSLDQQHRFGSLTLATFVVGVLVSWKCAYLRKSFRDCSPDHH